MAVSGCPSMFNTRAHHRVVKKKEQDGTSLQKRATIKINNKARGAAGSTETGCTCKYFKHYMKTFPTQMATKGYKCSYFSQSG